MSSIRRTDLLALAQLRNDGRRPDEIRRLRVKFGVVDSAGACGSALVEMGLTVALATVRGPLGCRRRSDERPDRALVEVTVETVPFAQGDRLLRNASVDRRLLESKQLVQRALEATMLLQLFPKSRFVIDVHILADDGGRLCAAINAASMAVADAGIPTKDLLCSCSAGLVSSGASDGDSDSTIVDLNRREESSAAGQAAVYLPCALLPQRGTIVLSQCEARLPDFDSLERVLNAAMDGCRAVFDIFQAALRERATALLKARSGRANISLAMDDVIPPNPQEEDQPADMQAEVSS